MFKYFEPNKIFSITSKAPKYVLFLFIVILSIGLTEALILSPEDYKQSHSVRIMYVHVPAAWISLGIFSVITFLSIVGYIFKIRNFFLIAKSLAPSGLVFNIIALVTGSIWGKPTWGTWWAWDARITSMLILALFYIMYLVAWRIFEDNDKAFKVTSIITILGIINVPIIKYSVDWWNTLHQPASINILSKSSIHISMLFPLMTMTAAFALFSLLIFLMKYNTELIKIKNKGLELLIITTLTLSVFLLVKSLEENVIFFKSPTEIKTLSEIDKKKIRIGGMVKKDSITMISKEIKFIVTDFKNEINVVYSGVVPNLFAEEKGVVAEGYLKDKNFFLATKILAKHDENYMPPEVKAALEEK